MRIGVLIRASLISFAVTVCLSCESSEISQAETNSESSDNRILNLYDAFGKRHEQAIFDFGFSALIEYNGKTILFDSGTDAEIFRQNVEAFDIDLRKVDFAVASHSHADHISGFDYLLAAFLNNSKKDEIKIEMTLLCGLYLNSCSIIQ